MTLSPDLDAQLDDLYSIAKEYEQDEKNRNWLTNRTVVKKVDEVTTRALAERLAQLDTTLASHKGVLSDAQYDKLKNVFFDTLSTFSNKVFDRKNIKENSSLEIALGECYKKSSGQQKGIHELRTQISALQERRKSGEHVPPTELEATLIEQEAKFAMALGVKAQSGAGAMSNSYFLLNLQGKKIAIFKPDVEGSRGKENPKPRARINAWLTKNIYQFFSIRQMRQRVSETFAFKASLLLNSPIVPPSKISAFTNEELGLSHQHAREKRGSLQILVSAQAGHRIAEAKDILNVAATPTIFRVLVSALTQWIEKVFTNNTSLEQLKKEPLFINEKSPNPALSGLPEGLLHVTGFTDFALGQLDRHFGNFLLVVKDPNTPDGHIGVSVDRLGLVSEKGSYIVLIDNGAALGKTHPTLLEAHNMYLCSELPIPQKPFYQGLPEGIPPDGWDTSLLREFFCHATAEEMHDVTSDKSVEAMIADAFQYFNFKQTDKEEFILSCKKIFNEKVPQYKDLKKIQERVTKVLAQLYTMNQRLDVLKIFLNPPKQYESLYTLKLLGSIKTEEDYKIFWKMVEEHKS